MPALAKGRPRPRGDEPARARQLLPGRVPASDACDSRVTPLAGWQLLVVDALDIALTRARFRWRTERMRSKRCSRSVWSCGFHAQSSSAEDLIEKDSAMRASTCCNVAACCAWIRWRASSCDWMMMLPFLEEAVAAE